MGGVRIAQQAKAELSAVADPSKAGPMAAYMKTDMPFYGVQKAQRTPILRSLRRSFPPRSRQEYEANIRLLWNEPHREEKYLAIGYARSFPRYIAVDSIPMFHDLVVEGAWWDFVDEVATQLIGKVLDDDRTVAEPTVRAWTHSDDMWLRRVSIICQLKHKERTNTSFLSDACLANISDREFFIRKAIGWALREYAKTNPDWVRSFVADNESAMAPLSIREAMKHLR
jgi:3-methyladenine DNA glycosylase AlkD